MICIKSIGHMVAQEKICFLIGKKDAGTRDFNSILSGISFFAVSIRLHSSEQSYSTLDQQRQ